MNARVLDLCYAIAVLLGAVVLYLTGGSNPTPVPVASNPYWYPKLLLALLAVCAIWLLLRSMLQRRHADAPESVQWRTLFGTVVISGAFMAGYEGVGFVPCAVALIVVLAWFQGFRRPLLLAVIAVLFTAVAWYGFADLLNRAPPGPALPSFAGLFG